MLTAQTVGNLSVETDKAKMIRAIFASLFGWSLDLFDLYVLLYVAPTIGALFFPSSQPTLSLAAVYGSFAVTLLMRPIGSAIFGQYADSHGRKGAMTFAVIGVGLSTAAFGLLPTIQQAGYIAPVMFLILRLVQGVLVGGVVASTHTIGTESVPARWRGMMSGLIGGGGAGIGALLASLAFFVTSTIFPGEAFAIWGWRCMFFSGLLSSILGIFVMTGLEESPFWQQLQKQKAEKQAGTRSSPLRELFGSQFRNVLLINVLVTFGGGAAYYLTSGYMPTFFKIINGIPNNISSLILMAASITTIIASGAAGELSQHIGRKLTFILVGIVGVLALPWLYIQLGATKDLITITIYSLAIIFIGNTTHGPIMIFLNERFPTAFRATGTGLSWNIGFALGGTMPSLVSAASVTIADIPRTLAMFTAGIYVVYLIGGFLVRETKDEME
jgi:MHS family proline/betaine transporter-like MFS transporter